MVEIPVERKSTGVPWWVWLLGALLLLGVLWWIFADNDREEVALAPAPVVVTEPIDPVVAVPVTGAAIAPVDGVAAASGPITDLATILGTADRAALAGRPVDLANMRVLDVVGDRTFFVGPDQNRRVFVVLNEVPTPGGPPEGRYNVEPGQVININGVMRRPDDAVFAGRPIEDMPAGTAALIHAQSLDIVRRP